MNRRLAAPAPLRRAIERIEQLRAVDPIATWARRRVKPVSEGQVGDVLTGQWLGHALHPLLTDFPMGCWIGSAVLDLAGGKASRGASTRLVAAGLAMVPVTAATGMADWSTVRDRPAQRVGLVHGVGNVLVTLCYLRSWRRRHQGHHLHGVAWGFTGGALAMVTGYLGGHLSFNLGTGVEDRGLRLDARWTTPSPNGTTSVPVADRGPVESWEGLD
jgi:uncharacterized membrane protein